MFVKEKFMAFVNAVWNFWRIFSFVVRISYHIFRYFVFSLFARKPERPSSTALDLSDGRPTSPASDVASTQDILADAINVANKLQKNGEQQSFKDLFLRFNAIFKQESAGRKNRIKSSFCDRVNDAECLDWNGVGDETKARVTQECVGDIKKILGIIMGKFPVADMFSGLEIHYESDATADDVDAVAGSAVDRDDTTENTSNVVAIKELPSITDADTDEKISQDVMEPTGQLKKTNVQKHSKISKYSGNIGLGKRFKISQNNWAGKNQSKYSDEDLDEFQSQIRNTVSGMDLNLDLIADRVTNLELKFNKMDEEIKNLITK